MRRVIQRSSVTSSHYGPFTSGSQPIKKVLKVRERSSSEEISCMLDVTFKRTLKNCLIKGKCTVLDNWPDFDGRMRKKTNLFVQMEVTR